MENLGWTFTDSSEVVWADVGPGVEMKMLGGADGRMIALFRFEPGYVGGIHEHRDAEFTYVLAGSIVSNGVMMHAGHAYAVGAGTTHSEFRTDTGCTVVSVFPIPA